MTTNRSLPILAPAAKPTDRLGRPLRDLRISVTDRCNFRCIYCMPREVFGPGFEFLGRSELLTFEEVARLARIFAGLGVVKLRITGGEPLLRRDIEELVRMLAATPEIEELTMTTNGSLLAPKARMLREAGLDRITVSLDALDDAVFRAMSDVPIPVARVLEGIEAAGEAGLGPVKVNMVVKRGVNEDQIVPLARHFRGSGHILRFIEFMDVGTTNGWRLDDVVPAREIRERLEACGGLEALRPNYPGEVATRYRWADGGGELGIIHSVSHPFCSSCTRARLTANGELYTCLFGARGHDLRALLRSDADDATVAGAIRAIWAARTDRYSELRSEATEGLARVEMSRIGG